MFSPWVTGACSLKISGNYGNANSQIILIQGLCIASVDSRSGMKMRFQWFAKMMRCNALRSINKGIKYKYICTMGHTVTKF